MKTLIITVGTRQIGWRCQDNIIRCFGTDGGRNDPPHTDELYQELNIERGKHQGSDRTYPWGVKDLGERYFQHCTEWLGGDFRQVELLLDGQIITDYAKQGLDHIILWGTNQPENISWNYRRLDTLWLAQLMAGKIKSLFPQIQVDVFDPIVAVNDANAIRQELEEYILKYLQEILNNNNQNQLVLLIENKGAAPSISENLAICAAGLARQYEVSIITPDEPTPLYEICPNNQKSSCLAKTYQISSLSQYFLPLEKIRIISAWERGDFEEAKIWLESHQKNYEAIYKLAQWLSLAVNGEIDNLITDIKFNDWMNSKAVAKITSAEQIQTWKKQLQKIQNNSYAKTWESLFLIECLLRRKNYTNAFILFSQTLERLLYLQFHDSNLDFCQLINEWCKVNKNQSINQWSSLFHKIRQNRNDVIHEAKAISQKKFSELWANNSFPVPVTQDAAEMIKPLREVLIKVCKSSEQVPSTTLLHSLYEWGLNVLRT